MNGWSSFLWPKNSIFISFMSSLININIQLLKQRTIPKLPYDIREKLPKESYKNRANIKTMGQSNVEQIH